ncbi:hypothetical protein ABPG74_020664 [Tetrahymena malaccensis]
MNALKQTEEIMTEQQQSQLENSMKDLLEKILTYMEKFIKTKDDLQAIESKLNDYDNLNSLLDIIKSIFSHLTAKIDEQLPKDKTQQKATNENNEDYDQLEKILQKHEAEIRTHIRLEQQLKLYAENLQSKLDESEQARSELLESTKAMINDIKRQNNALSEQLSKLQQENQTLIEQVKGFNENEKLLEEKLYNMPYLQQKIQTLEKLVKDNMQEKYLTASMQNLQKENSFKKVIAQNEQDLKKVKKPETPPINQMMTNSAIQGTSPIKVERRAPTPNLNSQGKVIKENSIKASYQRFYNNIKMNREDQTTSSTLAFQNDKSENKIEQKNKDIRAQTIYANIAQKNGINQLIQSSLRERDAKTLNSGGGSITNSHNNSIICNNSNSSKNFKQTNHKRSKSHQVNKIRGMVNGNIALKNPTDYSRLSNQDFSDIQITTGYNK